ncbi:hypothetical protein CTI12_AA100140 [Artemisia annua]|uniref:Hybrid signal transduction histidine kinase M n=1 Tax=Artemisia annua TaxID=35608 RepID=A0A2U1PXM4_ARTAN|nr:hypothetical protein CTI12_AA100140 [Artemisia annua]
MVTEITASPTPSKYAKVLTTKNFKNLIPLKLDAEMLNYSNWYNLFPIQIRGCQALEFIQPLASKCVLKSKSKIARDSWEFLEKTFKDNKRSKTVELVGELRSLDIGDLTVDAYFRKIDSLATRLDNLGSNITEDDLVTYTINDLSDKYDQVAHVILNRDPFLDLETVRSWCLFPKLV